MSLSRSIRLALRDNDFLRTWVRPPIAWLLLKVLKRKQRLLQKYGLCAVRVVHKVAQSVGMSYYADGGTLLGFIRDDGFIPHDIDMDFSLMPDNGKIDLFYRELKAHGLSFERFVLFDGRLKEFTMSYNEVGIDFFQRYYSSNKDSFLTVATKKDDFWPVFARPVPKGFKVIPIRGCQVVIPVNYDEILTSLYGDWRTPVVKWEDTMAPKYDKDYGAHVVVQSRDEDVWKKFLAEG